MPEFKMSIIGGVMALAISVLERLKYAFALREKIFKVQEGEKGSDSSFDKEDLSYAKLLDF